MKRAHYGKGSRASTLFNFAFREDSSFVNERPFKCKAFNARNHFSFFPHSPLIEDKENHIPELTTTTEEEENENELRECPETGLPKNENSATSVEAKSNSAGSSPPAGFQEQPSFDYKSSDLSQSVESEANINRDQSANFISITPPRYTTHSHSVSSDDELSPEIISTTSEKSMIHYQDSLMLVKDQVNKSSNQIYSPDDSLLVPFKPDLPNLDAGETQSLVNNEETSEQLLNITDIESAKESNIGLCDRDKKISTTKPSFEVSNQSFDSNYLGDISSVLFEDDENSVQTPTKSEHRLTRQSAKLSKSIDECANSVNMNSIKATNGVFGGGGGGEIRRKTRSTKPSQYLSAVNLKESSQNRPKYVSDQNPQNQRKFSDFIQDRNTRSVKESDSKTSRSDLEIESVEASALDQTQDLKLKKFNSSELKLNAFKNLNDSRTKLNDATLEKTTDDQKQSSEQFEQIKATPDDNNYEFKYGSEKCNGSPSVPSDPILNKRKTTDRNSQMSADNGPKHPSPGLVAIRTTRSAVNRAAVEKSEQKEYEIFRASEPLQRTRSRSRLKMRNNEKTENVLIGDLRFTEGHIKKNSDHAVVNVKDVSEESSPSGNDGKSEGISKLGDSTNDKILEAFEDGCWESSETDRNEYDIREIENQQSKEAPRELTETSNCNNLQPGINTAEQVTYGKESIGSSLQATESRQQLNDSLESPRKSNILPQQVNNKIKRQTCANIGTAGTVTFSKLKKQHLRNFAKTRQSISLLPSQQAGRTSFQKELENDVCTQFTESRNQKRVNFDLNEIDDTSISNFDESKSSLRLAPKSLPEKCFFNNVGEIPTSQKVRASERKAGKLKRMTMKRVTRGRQGASTVLDKIEAVDLINKNNSNSEAEEQTVNCYGDIASFATVVSEKRSNPFSEKAGILEAGKEVKRMQEERLSCVDSSVVNTEELQLCTYDNLQSIDSGVDRFQWDQQVDKIGEGAFSEVFRVTLDNGEQRVLKVVPVKSHIERANADNEYQITSALSKLSPNFVHLYEAAYVHGKYPEPLLDAWDRYQSLYPSQALNCSPEALGSKTLFCVLSMEDAGTPLEHFRFARIDQVVSIVQQIACTLAVAEQQLQFEHRDLHMSNVLISQTRVKRFNYTLNPIGDEVKGKGKDKKKGAKKGSSKSVELNVNSRGLKATIIDYTLSRLTLDNQLKFNDLSGEGNADLFEEVEVEGGTASSTGGQVDDDQESVEKQFLVYRDMQRLTNNQWDRFVPETNVYWLHHLVDRLLYWKPKSHFSQYDPDRRARLKSVYRSDICSDKYQSCAQLVIQSQLLKL